jgi:superfamily I DNA and/or RNA helicase
MREADVIVSTSIGAADSRLLAACGMQIGEDELVSEHLNGNKKAAARILQNDVAMFAPDGLPPLSLPFVIIDEACQSVEPGSLIPVFSTNSCRSLVMLGDPCQLPPTVVSDESGTGESPLAISLMSRLSSALPQPVIVTAQTDKSPRDDLYLNLKLTKQAASLVRSKAGNSSNSDVSYRKRYSGSLLLSVQYRMHPSIAAFSSAVFYDSMLSTPKFLTGQRPVPEELDDILPLERGQASVRFVNISGSQNERRGDPAASIGLLPSDVDPSLKSSSYTNEAEATQLLDMLKEFMKNRETSNNPFDGSIGVITPYSGQVILLKNLIATDPEFRALNQKNPINIEINSIDAYQGRERDLIFFSTVRSNRRRNVGFLSDWRRMNVALTRAKAGLVVLGDMDTLVNDCHWEAFCGWCENVECVFDVDAAELSGLGFE